MTKEILGVDLIIYAGEERIAGQRNATVNITGDTIDTTTKDNGNWKTSLTGLLAWNCSLDLVEYAGQAGSQQVVFMKKMLNRETVLVRGVQRGKMVFEGLATITSKDTSGDYADVSTGSYQLNGAGQPIFYFVPYIDTISSSGTTVTITLTEPLAEVNNNAVLTNAITIGGVQPTAATLENGIITCTLSEAASTQAKVVIAAESIKNGLAIQTEDLESEIE